MNSGRLSEADSEGGFTQKSSEGDGRGQGRKVNEDDGREDLRVQGILVIADVVTVTALQVLYHAAERKSCPYQRVLPRWLWRLHNCNEKVIFAINDPTQRTKKSTIEVPEPHL